MQKQKKIDKTPKDKDISIMERLIGKDRIEFMINGTKMDSSFKVGIATK